MSSVPTDSLDPELKAEVNRFYAFFGCSSFLVDFPIWSFYFTQYCGLSLSAAVALHSLTFLSQGLFDLPTSSWADRFGRKNVLLLGLTCRIVAAGITLLIPTPAALVGAAILTGFGWAQIMGTFEALLHDNLKAAGREDYFNVAFPNTLGIQYASRSVAFGVSGFLFEIHPTLPLMPYIAALIVAIYAVVTIPERAYVKSEAKGDLGHIGQGLRLMLGTAGLPAFVTISLLVGITGDQLWVSFQPLLSSAELTPSLIGLSYAFGAMASLAGNRLARNLIARGSEAAAYTLSALAFGIGGVTFALFTSPSAAIAALFATSVGFGLSWPSRSALVNRVLPSSHRATCLSIIGTMEFIILGVIGGAGGFFFETFGRWFTPALSAVGAFAALPFLIVVARKLQSVNSIKGR